MAKYRNYDERTSALYWHHSRVVTAFNLAHRAHHNPDPDVERYWDDAYAKFDEMMLFMHQIVCIHPPDPPPLREQSNLQKLLMARGDIPCDPPLTERKTGD